MRNEEWSVRIRYTASHDKMRNEELKLEFLVTIGTALLWLSRYKKSRRGASLKWKRLFR